MGFFKNLGDSLSGNTAHWTTTHNPVVNELLSRSNDLPGNGPQVFMNVIGTANGAIEFLVFPKKSEPLINIDLKLVTSSQFRQLYTIIIAFMISKSVEDEPAAAKRIKPALLRVVGEDQHDLAKKTYTETKNSFSEEVSAQRLWKSLTSVLQVEDTDIQKITYFYTVLIRLM